MLFLKNALLGLTMVLLAGCEENLSFLDPQGAIAAAQRSHYWFVVALSLIVVLPVIILTPWLLYRYRYGGKAPYRPLWAFSWKMEWLIWGMPFLIVLVLSYVLWNATHELDPYRPLPSDKEPLRVQVVGFDWKWFFIYPEHGIATSGKLVFPADRPLALELTSNTVMQSFFIPSLGSQIYAMNNMVTKLHLIANGPGAFRGQNVQYNGKHFHEQRFTAESLSQQGFSEFLKKVRDVGLPMDTRSYEVFARSNTLREVERALGDETPDGVVLFSRVPDELFEAIVSGPHRVHSLFSSMSTAKVSDKASAVPGSMADALNVTQDKEAAR